MKSMLAAIALLLPTAAQATTLYDNLYAHQDDFDVLDNVRTLADSFSTTSTPFVFKDLKLLLRYALVTPNSPGDNPPGVPAIGDIYLLADNATFPGAVIAHLGTFKDTDLPLSFSPIDFTFAPITLSPDTRYWIFATAERGTHAEWGYSLDISGTGVAGEFFYVGPGSVASNIHGPYQMRISDDVPEPATLLLWLAALPMVGWWAGQSCRMARRKG